jgi:hypothetical protein
MLSRRPGARIILGHVGSPSSADAPGTGKSAHLARLPRPAGWGKQSTGGPAFGRRKGQVRPLGACDGPRAVRRLPRLAARCACEVSWRRSGNAVSLSRGIRQTRPRWCEPSHSIQRFPRWDLGLIAVTRGLRVGIDVERVRDVPDVEAILNDFFSRQESAHVRLRKGKERTRAFFRLWTRREAAAKALGIGLFDCFARVELPTPDRAGSGFRVGLPESDTPAGPTRAWWMRDLLPAPGYAGAVCMEQRNAKPVFLVFSP